MTRLKHKREREHLKPLGEYLILSQKQENFAGYCPITCLLGLGLPDQPCHVKPSAASGNKILKFQKVVIYNDTQSNDYEIQNTEKLLFYVVLLKNLLILVYVLKNGSNFETTYLSAIWCSLKNPYVLKRWVSWDHRNEVEQALTTWNKL